MIGIKITSDLPTSPLDSGSNPRDAASRKYANEYHKPEAAEEKVKDESSECEIELTNDVWIAVNVSRVEGDDKRALHPPIIPPE